MCSLRRPEVGLDPQVKLQRTAAEPGPSPCSEIRRLGYFLEPQHFAVEASHGCFTTGRQRKLNVIDSVNAQGWSSTRMQTDKPCHGIQRGRPSAPESARAGAGS